MNNNDKKAYNIKETAIRQYIIKTFNENPLKIPFSMGTFDADDELKEMYIFSYSFSDNGNFDIREKVDPKTYTSSKESVVIIEPSGLSGDFVSHPNIKSGTFEATIDILVNVDTPMANLIGMMVEYVRDSFVGKLGTITTSYRDFSDPNDKGTKTIYTVASNSGTIDFGNIFILNGRRYSIYSFPIYFEVSQDIAYGNQLEWNIGIYNEYGEEPLELLESKPIITSFGKIKDLQPYQVLRSKDDLDNPKAKELHSYVQTRGFALVFTYLVNFKDSLIRELYKESFNISDNDLIFKVEMKTKILNDNGEFVYDNELTFTRKMVGEIFMPEDIVIGEPIVLTVGLSPSAK